MIVIQTRMCPFSTIVVISTIVPDKEVPPDCLQQLGSATVAAAVPTPATSTATTTTASTGHTATADTTITTATTTTGSTTGERRAWSRHQQSCPDIGHGGPAPATEDHMVGLVALVIFPTSIVTGRSSEIEIIL